MVSEDELFNVLKTTLQDNGQYPRIKADLMYQLMQALGMDKQLTDMDKPQPPISVGLVNQLIMEYFSWAGYKFSETVFSAEASVSTTKVSREELRHQLKVKDSADTEGMPLLFALLSTVQEAYRKREK